ncbi:MAG: hypothetical protein ACQESR_29170, partial [Planctomycetota bacterium]
MENCPTQVVLPLVGLTADKVTRERYNLQRPKGINRPPARPSGRVGVSRGIGGPSTSASLAARLRGSAIQPVSRLGRGGAGLMKNPKIGQNRTSGLSRVRRACLIEEWKISRPGHDDDRWCFRYHYRPTDGR